MARGSERHRPYPLSIASMSSADDAADEYEEWDLEEDYSDDGDGEEEAELKE